MEWVTGWYRPDAGALPRGVIAADARAAAAAFWAGPIASILEEVAERLPSDRYPDVVFLGGRSAHPLSAVLGAVSPAHPDAGAPAVDLQAQLGRYPVAGPILREVCDGPARPVLLLLTRPAINLADWPVGVGGAAAVAGRGGTPRAGGTRAVTRGRNVAARAVMVLHTSAPRC